MEASQESIESINTTIEIYDYEEMSENEIDTMFKEEKTASGQGNLLKGIENYLGVALSHTASLDTIFIQIYMDALPGVPGVLEYFKYSSIWGQYLRTKP